MNELMQYFKKFDYFSTSHCRKISAAVELQLVADWKHSLSEHYSFCPGFIQCRFSVGSAKDLINLFFGQKLGFSYEFSVFLIYWIN
jgi:hypothetical protein